jgi:hypothetical protein
VSGSRKIRFRKHLDYDQIVSDHIQTLFGSTEEGYKPTPDPEPGDIAWRKLTWVLYPLMFAAIFMRGPHSKVLNEVFWTVFVMGLLITNEWMQIKKPRTQMYIAVAFFIHLSIMGLSYGWLPEPRPQIAIIFVSVLESILLGVPIRLLSAKVR